MDAADLGRVLGAMGQLFADRARRRMGSNDSNAVLLALAEGFNRGAAECDRIASGTPQHAPEGVAFKYEVQD
jgi:hypothetical protein